MKEYEPDIQKQKTSLTPEGLPEVNDAIDISEGYLSRILRVGRNLTQGGLSLIGRQPYAAVESAADNAPHAF